jgi:hypothetical protein
LVGRWVVGVPLLANLKVPVVVRVRTASIVHGIFRSAVEGRLGNKFGRGTDPRQGPTAMARERIDLMTFATLEETFAAIMLLG